MILMIMMRVIPGALGALMGLPGDAAAEAAVADLDDFLRDVSGEKRGSQLLAQ